MVKKNKSVIEPILQEKSFGKHIGNLKVSSSGKGINIIIFATNTYGTIPLSRIEVLIDEVKITGKSGKIIPIIQIVNPNTNSGNLDT